MPPHGSEKMLLEACRRHFVLPSHLYGKEKRDTSVLDKTPQSFKEGTFRFKERVLKDAVLDLNQT